jgi:hypothetical protein
MAKIGGVGSNVLFICAEPWMMPSGLIITDRNTCHGKCFREIRDSSGVSDEG